MASPKESANAFLESPSQSGINLAGTADEGTMPFRPQHRPPMAVLRACEDGKDIGQTVHIYKEDFVIGRTEGDFVVEHDASISSTHAEVVRRHDGARYQWFLKDLGSTNGTFVRVGKAVLEHNQELLLGGYRYRFDAGGIAAQTAGNPPETRKWEPAKAISIPELLPALVQQVEPEQRLCLKGGECWIGRDPQCDLPVSDAMLSPRHAKLTLDRQGRWEIANNSSKNGVWIRVNQVHLGAGAQFQIGEQRFVIRIP